MKLTGAFDLKRHCLNSHFSVQYRSLSHVFHSLYLSIEQRNVSEPRTQVTMFSI